MKSRAGSQLVQAVLFMMALVCGLWLLPGGDPQERADCRTPANATPLQLSSWSPVSESCTE